MTAAIFASRLSVRTVWLSDIHLGCKDCRAQYLLDFLQRVECETLYLLGDIIDFWALKRQFIWPAAHYEVLRTIMHKAKHGTRVIYVPGNHDEVMREFVGNHFGPIEIRQETTHVTADGKELLLFHGDVLDPFVHMHINKFSRVIGDPAYDFLMWLHRWCNRGRRVFGLPYWSLANYVKTRIKNAREAINAFSNAAIHEAKRRGFDGVVCGHIHHAEITQRDGVLYCNDGDWIESCTALIEQHGGKLDILRWADFYRAAPSLPIKVDELPPLAIKNGSVI